MAVFDTSMPIIELEMTERSLKIRLADEQASLSVTLSKAFVTEVFEKWKAFQSGTVKESVAFGRHYTGDWPKEI